jgi:hypothetical protein
MRFGPRRPSLRKKIAARTSIKRLVRHSLGLKAPRGMGWLTNPKRAAYNRLYNRTTFSVGRTKPSRHSTGCSVLVLELALLGFLALRAL